MIVKTLCVVTHCTANTQSVIKIVNIFALMFRLRLILLSSKNKQNSRISEMQLLFVFAILQNHIEKY